MLHELHPPLQCGIEVVFNVVVSATRQELSYLRPAVAESVVSLDDEVVFLFGPLVFLNIWVQVIMPPLF